MVGLELEAIEQIKLECKQVMKGPRRPPSVHILADSKITEWPTRDNISTVDFKPEWNFRKWISALRAEMVRVDCHTVILYLERIQQYEAVPPLKNNLHTMCKILRQHYQGVRIFVSNLLPRAQGSSPLSRPMAEVNYILLQAVRSVNQALGKVFFLSTFEHFVSSRNCRIIKPTHMYFRQDGELTQLGCITLRECFLREAGLKPYWFK